MKVSQDQLIFVVKITAELTPFRSPSTHSLRQQLSDMCLLLLLLSRDMCLGEHFSFSVYRFKY